MAVEAQHLNLFYPQILSNRELVMNGVEGNENVFGATSVYGVVASASRTAAAGMESAVSMYGSSIAAALPMKAPAEMKSDIGLTCVPASRKRSREAVNTLFSSFGGFTFLGEDISLQIQQQQLEIDRFIAQNSENVRMEMEERRRRHARRIAAAAVESLSKRLKVKEEEIEKIGKLNHALEERVKSLCAENRIWRDLAHANEAAANSLRSNLEQAIAQARDGDRRQADEVSSSCGSNHGEGGGRMCRSCGREESCVLLLPCRHMCLCTVCESTLHTCPICNATKTASVHVNLAC
ncbi:Probable BOI-related E3 ubiquitin-protein ligase 3 [Striga hermonthica]|uniref:Probable BOI-related E3 ubiquitin-protein ligase 3 n=1 Tax=Striga hermonthica TaxID=68872 RepID=A0A9N7N2B5_STRHE|nr:Probable BOI-related E3 ubiquitin-protein ligase 3 [Striga hermonthica]